MSLLYSSGAIAFVEQVNMEEQLHRTSQLKTNMQLAVEVTLPAGAGAPPAQDLYSQAPQHKKL